MLSDMVYATQFQALRVWLDGLTPEDLSVDSVLPGWTVADLVGHLVGVAGTIAVLQPASDETEPSTISAYLSGYAATAGQISEIARQISASAGPELLARLDEANAEAQEHLGRLGAFDRVVSTQRGPMLLSDFLDTRLIELVVHAGDLAASLPAHHPPTVLPTASRRVALVMRELLTEKAAQPVEALAAASTMAVAGFIALAAGRDLPAGDLPPADLPAALTSALPLF